MHWCFKWNGQRVDILSKNLKYILILLITLKIKCIKARNYSN